MAGMSEAKKRANKKWNDANMKERYDRVQLVLPKGRKQEIQAEAERRGQSVNRFINELINEALSPDAANAEAVHAGGSSPAAEGGLGGGSGFSSGVQNGNCNSRLISPSAPDFSDEGRPYLPVPPWEDDSTPELEAKIVAVLRKRGISIPTIKQYRALSPEEQAQETERLLSEREHARQALDEYERRQRGGRRHGNW